MTKEQAENIYKLHQELVFMAATQYTDPRLNERNKLRFRRKERILKEYLESMIGDYMIVPLGNRKRSEAQKGDKDDKTSN